MNRRSVRELFDLVCDLPSARREHLLREAGADADQIARVLALIHAGDTLSTRSRTPLAGLAEWLDTEMKPGDALGPWKLVRELGRGGMGSVFLAERADGHFQQQAAIKLIRGRADPLAALRFARERQLLANLQHPRIARLLDGGATPEGQPYLVMEYVDGQPIGEWCRQHDASLDTRLALFRSVCEAVQFAHGRLVVHCDLKPSNVLVRADGTPMLLDFGIARALESQAEPGTPASGDAASSSTSQTLMTPRYASPEQLRGQVPGIETDVFALGLMLHELTSGEAPPRDRSGGLPLPSVAAAPALPWKQRLRGDIDAIVAKACTEDAAQRYASVADLAQDVDRIARREPVRAREGQRLYAAARFLQRRWVPLSITALMLALATGFTWRTLLAERSARQEADIAQRATDFMVSVFASADTDVNKSHIVGVSALDVLDSGRRRIQAELTDAPAVRARLLEAIGNAYRHQQANRTAVPMLDEAVTLFLSPEVNDPTAAARASRSQVNAMANGQFSGDATLTAAERMLALTRATAAEGSQDLAHAWMVLSLAYNRTGRYHQAREAAQTTLALNQASQGEPDNRLGPALHNMAMILGNLGEYEAALPYIDRIIATNRPGSTSLANNYSIKGDLLRRLGRSDEALECYQRELEIAIAHFGQDSHYASLARVDVARVLAQAGRHAEAEAAFARALADQGRLANDDDTADLESLQTRHAMALAYLHAGLFTQAREQAEAVHRARVTVFGPDDLRSRLAARVAIEAALRAGQHDADQLTLLQNDVMFWHERGQFDQHHGLVTRLLLGYWHLRAGQVDAAHETFAAMLPHEQRLPSLERLFLHRLIAATQRRLHGPAAAISADEAALALHRRVDGDAHPRTALAALILARDLRANGDNTRADALEHEWQPRLERGFPPDSDYLRALPEA